jgi:hypothetical protein
MAFVKSKILYTDTKNHFYSLTKFYLVYLQKRKMHAIIKKKINQNVILPSSMYKKETSEQKATH